MTVKELIEQLQTLDPDLHVFTSGYEGGYEDVVSVGNVKEIALSYNTEWWYGPHTEADPSILGPSHSFEIVKGVIL
jgi:hypothetical protein